MREKSTNGLYNTSKVTNRVECAWGDPFALGDSALLAAPGAQRKAACTENLVSRGLSPLLVRWHTGLPSHPLSFPKKKDQIQKN